MQTTTTTKGWDAIEADNRTAKADSVYRARIAECQDRIADLRADIDRIIASAGWGSARHADRVTDLHAEYKALWRYEDAYYAGL